MLTYTIIISIILYIIGWLFTLCKMEDLSAKEYLEIENFGDFILLVVQCILWIPPFIYFFICHIFSFFTKKW